MRAHLWPFGRSKPGHWAQPLGSPLPRPCHCALTRLWPAPSVCFARTWACGSTVAGTTGAAEDQRRWPSVPYETPTRLRPFLRKRAASCCRRPSPGGVGLCIGRPPVAAGRKHGRPHTVSGVRQPPIVTYCRQLDGPRRLNDPRLPSLVVRRDGDPLGRNARDEPHRIGGFASVSRPAAGVNDPPDVRSWAPVTGQTSPGGVEALEAARLLDLEFDRSRLNGTVGLATPAVPPLQRYRKRSSPVVAELRFPAMTAKEFVQARQSRRWPRDQVLILTAAVAAAVPLASLLRAPIQGNDEGILLVHPEEVLRGGRPVVTSRPSTGR